MAVSFLVGEVNAPQPENAFDPKACKTDRHVFDKRLAFHHVAPLQKTAAVGLEPTQPAIAFRPSSLLGGSVLLTPRGEMKLGWPE